MKKINKLYLFCFCCIAFIGCDRLTKNLAKQHLKSKADITYLHNTIKLQYVENTGAALSLGDDLSKTVSFWLLSILPLSILTALLVYSIKNLQQFGPMKMIAIALIFSGGISNICDRILYDRHVTDFMNIGFGSIRTGIFNVADVCVTAGVIGLLIFFNDKQKPVNDNFNNAIT